MLFGPILAREFTAAPRRASFFVARTVYVAALLLLLATAWLVLTGTQVVSTVGDLARFGQIVFQILAPLQVALALFFSALFTASGIAHEKDRGTLDLLMMTSLTNHELVLGKLGASLVSVLTVWAAGIPFFAATVLFGGISFAQVLRLALITLGAILAAGSIGSTIALWREKTFQTVALTALLLVAWLGLGEAAAHGGFGESFAGLSAQRWGAALSPLRAVFALHDTAGIVGRESQFPSLLIFFAAVGALTVLLNAVAIARVRVWNPTQEVRVVPRAAVAEHESLPRLTSAAAGQTAAVHQAPGQVRQVWSNPILWREIGTWSLGKKILLIRGAYLVLFGLAALAVYRAVQADRAAVSSNLALILAPLFVLSFVLVNAVAVTTITSERDGKTLDLLLVTDLTPKEFIFGKLAGIFYVAKELVLLPAALCVYLMAHGDVSGENGCYLLAGLAVMFVFVAVLGLHIGMTYHNSRSAIGVSLGTIFFLFLGIATCMRIMVAFSGSYQLQLAPFLAFMVGGGLGLFFALGIRNPSSAIFLASLLCPIATFWSITSFLLNQTLGVFLVTALTYGFATAALLIPALFEFDVATGRTTGKAD
ncbi:MAG TPA: hypothetical protein VFE24_09675 [Pirellulales bacterium]|jgi:ABC-type transport system involved in multi-copper enzyme maturation permease subunit|nr:hypothetical protein [Pirellulales bacterium]